MLNTPLLIQPGRGLHVPATEDDRGVVAQTVAAGRYIPGLGEALMRQHSIQVRENYAEFLHRLQRHWAVSSCGTLLDVMFRFTVSVVLWHLLHLSRGESQTYLRTYLQLIITLSIIYSVAALIVWLHHWRTLAVAERAQRHTGGFLVGRSVMRQGVCLDRWIETFCQLADAVGYVNFGVAFYTLLRYRAELLKSAPILFETSVVLVAITLFLLLLPCMIGVGLLWCLPPIITAQANNFHQISHPSAPTATRRLAEDRAEHSTPTSPVAVISPHHGTATQETVTEGTNELPRFRFRHNPGPPAGSAPVTGLKGEPPQGGALIRQGSENISYVLPDNEAHCAICWSAYKDGAEIEEMPSCAHHFHAKCLDNWLHMTPTCPLCKEPLNPDENDSLPEP